MRARWIAGVAAVATAVALPAPAGATGPADCTGSAPQAAPGTAEWHLREAHNAYCASQRLVDTHTNPGYPLSYAQLPPQRRLTAMDPMREPTRFHGRRFRFTEFSFSGPDGAVYPAMLFRPCDVSCNGAPAELAPHEPPYPGVVIMHGGAANQEMYLWAAEGLAEAGYMVLTVNIGRTERTHYEATRAGLEWLLSSRNPHAAELDRDSIGLAGHSAGGVAVNRLGHEDPRVDAVVSWDRAQSSPLPGHVPLRTPSLSVTADYNCQQVPVCLPEPYTEPPDPLGPGNKDEDFRRLSAAGIDAMKIALRAATHLDFTEWPALNASRYGVITTLYYTLAWFDRHLKGDPAATARLTAPAFDDSADVHSIGTGRWDPAALANVPPRIAGQPVADRLSFHFRSAYWLEGGALACDRMPCP